MAWHGVNIRPWWFGREDRDWWSTFSPLPLQKNQTPPWRGKLAKTPNKTEIHCRLVGGSRHVAFSANRLLLLLPMMMMMTMMMMLMMMMILILFYLPPCPPITKSLLTAWSKSSFISPVRSPAISALIPSLFPLMKPWILPTMWGPPVISWFISPSNYSYHKP